MTELPVPIGTVVAGRYRVDRVLGAGSMGVVAAAFHLEFEQAVAIKFVSPDALGEPEVAARFRREVRAAAKIKSEHVARVLDVGALETGLPYMVMEFLEGRTLEDELSARGSLPVAVAVDYVLQAIEALAEAHAGGIVHRDLKPANLFVSRRADRSRVVKVLDFGVSKSLADSESSLRLTRTGTIVGSPLYMAPEQLRAEKTPDLRSDIWALGAILFELVSGRTPHSANSIPDLYAKLLRDAPSAISRHGAEIAPEFEAIVRRCLRLEPAERFANVSELAEALLPFAPARARVHAERARGVLFPGGPQQSEPPPSPANEKSRASAEGPSTTTVSSWGAHAWFERRRALSAGLGASFLMIVAAFAIFAVRLDPTASASTIPTSRVVAASALDAFDPLPSSSALAPAPLPSAPLVVPEVPRVKWQAEAKLASNGVGLARTTLSPPARSSQQLDERKLSSAQQVEPAGALSNFGGRK
ncbi:MAG TPA: serine/threonine-protein kinase [Polyangiaceae bacterium]|nr:serine/threonine-protein kinase [Polyangiaceae bacterium]